MAVSQRAWTRERADEGVVKAASGRATTPLDAGASD